MEQSIQFITDNKSQWLKQVSEIYDQFKVSTGGHLSVGFGPNLDSKDLMPFHVVLYASVVHLLLQRGYAVKQHFDSNIDCADYVYNKLGLKHYWKGSNHEEVGQNNILNLWRIRETEKDAFSYRVADYFKNTCFRNKDLSAVQNSIVEAFYNIFDHANAKGNAYIQIMYSKLREEIIIAIVDLGRGLVNTVKEFDKSIIDDCEAMKLAITPSFTISSTEHNKGWGLDNILSSTSSVRIVSGHALLTKCYDDIRYDSLDYSFPGTLIDFSVKLSDLDDMELLNEFDF